ncbi:MAG: transcription elongation factor [Nonlabens sp.]
MLSDFQQLKKEFHYHCLDVIASRLDVIDKNLKSLQKAKLNETKSSAGDKYETGRAMIQNQEELYKTQRAQTRSILNGLLQIDPDKTCNQVENGALVQLPMGFFYVGAGMGKLSHNNKDFFSISLKSPIGVQLKHKKAGDTYTLNNQTTTILNVY